MDRGADGRVRSRSAERPAIAWFISPHGLGHAARASAIVAACSARRGDLAHHLFTTVAPVFFADALRSVRWTFHERWCDLGMVQRSPFSEDVEATVRALDASPLAIAADIDEIVTAVAETTSRLVVADIAPLGLLVAEQLDLPSVLVENFTWDWIYRAYREPGLAVHERRIADLCRSATLRIQTEPVCQAVEHARTVAPISRARRRSRSELRAELGLAEDRPMVLVSLGDPGALTAIRNRFRPPAGASLVIPGDTRGVVHESDIVRVPSSGGPSHPELVAASDLVIGKLGYSTVAEIFHGRTAFAYLRRPRFPESPVLEGFVRRHIPSAPLPPDWCENPGTAEILGRLLQRPRASGPRPNGAARAAELILDLLATTDRNGGGRLQFR